MEAELWSDWRALLCYNSLTQQNCTVFTLRLSTDVRLKVDEQRSLDLASKVR